MKHPLYCSIFIIIFLLSGGNQNLLAQASDSTDGKQSNKWHENVLDGFQWVDPQRPDLHEINFIGGYSFHSTRGFWGKIPRAQLSIFTLRYNRKLFLAGDKHLLEYVGELSLSANYQIAATHQYQAGSFSGYGISPIGFQFNINQQNVVQPFLKTSTGFMYFDKAFPDSRGARFNFTLELGGGLELVIAEHMSLSIGYKYHHMSNGQTGQINPGVDSNIFYTGITVF